LSVPEAIGCSECEVATEATVDEWNTRTDTQEVEQLRQELANTGSSKELLELDLKEMRQELDEANTYISLLREAIIGGDYLAAKLL